MWFVNDKKQIEFSGGKNNWEETMEQASKCSFFKYDVDDEILEEDVKSCYNCRFRRWTEKSFVCLNSIRMQ